jgi:hypothetical protein
MPEMLKLVFSIGRAYAIRILVVLNPVPEACRSPTTIEGFRLFEKSLRDIAAPYPRVLFGTPLLRFYPNEIAFDGAPMIGAGPRNNSLGVADWIQSGLQRKP